MGAIPWLERACAAEPENVVWLSQLADACRKTNRFDRALETALAACRSNARRAEDLVMLARVLADRGQWEEAKAAYLNALAMDPDNARAHFGLAQALLAHGEFRPGWIEYEWRHQLDIAKGLTPTVLAPRWSGMRQPQSRILLIGDQGYGDTLQFARYIPEVAARCGEAMLICEETLAPLLARIDGIGRVFSRWRDVPGFASYASLSSLPYIFGTEPATIPGAHGYLAADPKRVQAWRERLSASGSGAATIGIAWAGRPTHPNDSRRSAPFAALAALAAAPGVRLVSLQKDAPLADAGALAASAVLDLGRELKSFEDTAALLQSLDLVVSIDSAVAHLAGALGRPVWVMLAMPSDWRWLLDRADSPWYDSVRLFRQRRPGDWEGVTRDVLNALSVRRLAGMR